ncbi:MAG: hypothetical protein ISR65_16380 [Bacteriovoracaceae bacterium]|nr:hypothetical protein [Bacteriovoracaceae bacterium]
MYNITYHFKFPETGEETLSYRLALKKKTLNYVALEDAELPDNEWTALDFCKCSHCPLKADKAPYCPIAKNLHNLVSFFKDCESYKKSMVFVETPPRSYAKNTSVQEGLFSIFGIIMATSNCPHMNFLKPMARFHLPFATADETTYRSLSTYLLHNFLLVNKSGLPVENNLNGLNKMYKEVEVVNKGILKRLKSVSKGDADKNAIVILNNFAQLIDVEFENNFENLNEIFGV